MNLDDVRIPFSVRHSQHSPVNVADVEDLAIDTMNNWVGAKELHINWCPAKVRGHGEVGDRCDKSDTSCDVVENSMLSWFGHGKAHECKSSASHDGTDSPIPVRAMGRDGDIDMFAILGVRYNIVQQPSLAIALAECLRENQHDLLLTLSALLPILTVSMWW